MQRHHLDHCNHHNLANNNNHADDNNLANHKHDVRLSFSIQRHSFKFVETPSLNFWKPP